MDWHRAHVAASRQATSRAIRVRRDPKHALTRRVRRPGAIRREISFVGVEVPEPSPRLEAGPRIVTALSGRSCVISFIAAEAVGVVRPSRHGTGRRGDHIHPSREAADGRGWRVSPLSPQGFHVPYVSALALSVDWHLALASTRSAPRGVLKATWHWLWHGGITALADNGVSSGFHRPFGPADSSFRAAQLHCFGRCPGHSGRADVPPVCHRGAMPLRATGPRDRRLGPLG